MTFRDFMERALYEPDEGYYSRSRTAWSEDADYVTAPQVDAGFGAAVARLAQECDAALGRPARFEGLEDSMPSPGSPPRISLGTFLTLSRGPSARTTMWWTTLRRCGGT